MKHENFKAERISRTATITLEGNIEQVFPLFGPVEEMKWAEGWEPIILYPASAQIEEGMIFATNGHGHGEDLFSWIVSKYQPDDHLIEYIVSTANRVWVINIRCDASSEDRTEAMVTYTYTGLNALGIEIDKHAIEKMYERGLKDWEEAINHYLKTGNKLTHH